MPGADVDDDLGLFCCLLCRQFQRWLIATHPLIKRAPALWSVVNTAHRWVVYMHQRERAPSISRGWIRDENIKSARSKLSALWLLMLNALRALAPCAPREHLSRRLIRPVCVINSVSWSNYAGDCLILFARTLILNPLNGPTNPPGQIRVPTVWSALIVEG